MRPSRPIASLAAAIALTFGAASADAARLAHDGLAAYDGGDSAAAAAFWREAAEEGSTYAMVAFGGLLEAGDGVPRDLEAARRWYLAAARAGDAHGMLLTAEALAGEDAGKSAEWLSRAAGLGHPRALQMLQSEPPTIFGTEANRKR